MEQVLHTGDERKIKIYIFFFLLGTDPVKIFLGKKSKLGKFRFILLGDFPNFLRIFVYESFRISAIFKKKSRRLFHGCGILKHILRRLSKAFPKAPLL